MNKALIKFSNSETLELSEGQNIIPVVKTMHNGEVSASQDKIYEIWYHISDGLIPSLAELICKCDFFILVNNRDKAYKSSAVVSIENI